jgi:diguanylate cyclase (GGDEF)-like protein
VAALIICGLAAAIAVAVGLHQDAHERAEQDTSRLAIVLAEQLSRMLQAVDLVLTGIDKEIGLSHLSTPEQFRSLMSTQAIHIDLVSRLSGLPQADALMAIGADGAVLNLTRDRPASFRSVADRAYFQLLQAPGAPVQYISEPFTGRASGTALVVMLRRITASDGTFLGLLAAPVRLTYLQEFYAAIGLPAGTAVTALRRDGLVLAGWPADRQMRTSIMPAASAWYATVAAGGGSYWSPGWLDGDARQVSVRPVPGFPVVINVSMARDAIYARWQQQVVALTGGTVCILLCLLLLLRALVAQFRRLEATQATLRQKSTLLETTLRNMDQGLVMVTAEHRVGVCNDRALTLLGLPTELMHEGIPVEAVIDYQRRRGEFADTDAAMAALRQQGGFLRQVHAHQRQRPDGTVLEIRSVPLPDGGMVRTYTDITQRAQDEARINHAARHDVLTCLPNRALFAQRLNEALSGAEAADAGLAVMFLDLDRFKLINDTLGHAAGDELLRQVAERMRTGVRDSDTLARMGGDEFALVMPGMRAHDAIATAERLRCAVRESYVLTQGTGRIGVSIGIACYPDHGRSVGELLNHADLALYRAKAAGRDMCCLFDAALDRDKRNELVLESEMQGALQDEQFALVYQPIWDIQARRIVGAEALARWHHPIEDIVSPAKFIPIAERTGWIVELGRWAMEAACHEAMTWTVPISVSVNVSPIQLRRREIVTEVRDLLAATGLPAARLKLEVTEGQMLEETADMVATMTALRDLGVRLALDDFGTGHSSLSTLRRFPFSDLKIDRCFTQAIVQDDRSRCLIEAILQVCRLLDLECVAEGVETEEQMALLRSLGCPHAQGYLIGRPEPADSLRAQLSRGATGERHNAPKQRLAS